MIESSAELDLIRPHPDAATISVRRDGRCGIKDHRGTVFEGFVSGETSRSPVLAKWSRELGSGPVEWCYE